MWRRRHGGHEVAFLLVENPDRLAPSGLPYLETPFEVLGVQIVVMSHQDPKDAQAELIKDMLSVVTSFFANNGVRAGARRVRR